jgi:hypothetical protein
MGTEFGDGILLAEHHDNDVLDNAWTNARVDFYGVIGLPRVWFDGLSNVGGVTSCSQAASLYRAAIQQRLAQTGGLSPVAIDGSWARDDETVTLTATFRKLDPVALPDARAFLLLQEDDIPYDGIVYNRVTRAAYEQDVTLAAVGDSVRVTADLAIDDAWDLGRLHAIAFLQRVGATREVYQAARLPALRDFTFGFDDAIAGVPGGTGQALFHGTLTNTGDATDTLTITLENPTGWLAQFRADGDPAYHADPSSLVLEPGGAGGVDLRVITDAAARAEAVDLLIASRHSGRTHHARARVFNGSPAILLIDDDRAATDETLIEEALDARGYLHDDFNVFVDHIDEGPSAACLKDYDIVLWHTGWSTFELLTASDVAALTSYLDGGGRLLLSSQECLTELTPSTFTQQYLGLSAWTRDVGAARATGVPDDPIGDGVDAALQYETQGYDRADDLAPDAFGTVILRSDQGRRIALRVENGSRRTVFFAFGLNAMDPAAPDPDNPAALLDRAIRWLIESPDVAVPEPAVALIPARIAGVAPNPLPLPGAARIRLRLPGRDEAWLGVFDAAGRCLRRLPAGEGAGCGVAWDGRDASGHPVPAGVYALRLTTAAGCDRARIVVVR